MIRALIELGERLAGRRDPRFWRGLAFAVALSAVSAGVYGLLASFVANVAATGLLDRAQLVRAFFALAALVVLEVIVARPALANVFVAAFSLMGHARVRLLEHMRRLPMGFFGTQRSGALAGVVTTDIALVEDIWAHVFALFTADLLLPFLLAPWLISIDWRMAAATFLTLPAALALLRLVLPLLMRRVRALFDATKTVNADVVEFVQGAAVWRAFGRHGEGFQRLQCSLERLRQAQLATELGPSPLFAIYGFTVEMSVVVVALLGARFVADGTLLPRDLVLFLLISVAVSRRLYDFGTGILQLRTASEALARIDGLLNERPLQEPSQERPWGERFDVDLETVTFGYERTPVLHDVSAQIPERTLTALVGPSGSGKSTLVHLIARLWDVEPGRGSIRVGGVDVRDLSVESLHRRLSVVFQDVVLFSGTILENIRIGRPEASVEEVEAAAKAARAHDFICALPEGYQTPVAEGGSSLSGGERQRISIARAFLKDAPIILLDEATASVDSFAEADIQRAIDELVQERTVIVIAHRLKTIERADQILVLEHGRIVERGRHTSLLAQNGLYSRLWERQNPPCAQRALLCRT